MLKNFFPNKILSIKNQFINGLIILMIFIILFGLIYSLFISPEDYIQGDSVRIMYVHVPSSFIALGIFALIGIGSIFNLLAISSIIVSVANVAFVAPGAL